jgi:glycosyltransferase involved in cell wall biosynthesis
VKVLFVVPYYAPAWDFGGPVRAAQSLAVALAGRGHEVHVWTSDAVSRSARLPRAERDVVQDGVRVRRYPTWALQPLQHANMFVTPGMGARQPISAFDVVHLHEFRTFQNAWLAPRLVSHRVPYVLTPHGSFARRGRVACKIAYDLIAGRLLVNRARCVTALTCSESSDMQRLGVSPDRIRLLPNGVGCPPGGAPKMKAARARLGLPDTATVILFLGRLHPIKGPDLLLSAVAAVERAHPESHLLYAGPDEGSERRLRQSAEDLGLASKVRFLGSVDDEEKEAAYAAADVVALPSRSEGMPVTLLEALLRCKPVVCTEACAFDAAVSSCAEVVGADADDIAAGVLRVLSDPVRAAARANAGAALVQRHYTLDQVASVAEQIYAESSAARCW